MKNIKIESLQSVKVAASQTLKTRVIKSKKQYSRKDKHKAVRYSNENGPLFLWNYFTQNAPSALVSIPA